MVVRGGKMKVCSKCQFRIPENEWELFKACGQCGSRRYRED